MEVTRFIRWLWSLMPCACEWELIANDPPGWNKPPHLMRCTKCRRTVSCGCLKCREPWRDW